MTMESKAIILENITKSFFIQSFSVKSNKPNKTTLNALENISFTVSKGEVFGIIGMNGSGKTTLLRIIAGLYQPTTGNLQVNGKISPILQIGIGFQPELTAKENIIISGLFLGFPKKVIESKIDDIVKFADLEQFVGMKLKHYSSGMRARLAFSTVLQLDPDIILVDEMLSVGDAIFKQKSFEAFSSFKSKGKTIVYTTHSVRRLKELCDRVLVLHKGKIFFIGKSEEAVEKYSELINKIKKKPLDLDKNDE